MNVSSFSTANVRPKDRIEIWGEQIWSAIGRLNTKVDSGTVFNGAVRFADAGVIKLCNIGVGPHHIERTPQLIRRDDPGLLKVAFQLKGRTFLEQCDKQLVLSPGEWCIYETSRPYRLTTHEPSELLAMLVPKDKLSSQDLDVSAYMLHPFSSTTGLGKLIHSFMDCMLNDMHGFDAESGANLADIAIDLLHMAIFEQFRSRSVLPAGDLLKAKVKSHINRHLRDPDFSIATLAEAMNCSKRYLHKTFREDQETLSHFLWNRRLDRCRADLLDPELMNKSITEIAFSWGFSNSAHFSRCFKKRFGVTPSGCRLSALSAHAADAAGAELPTAALAASA